MTSINPANSSGHHLCRSGEHGRDDDRQDGCCEPRLDPLPACTTRFDPAPEAARGDLHPDERVGGRKGPLGRDSGKRERPGLVRQRRDGRVVGDHDPLPSVSSPCSATTREERVVREAPEAGRADHLVGAVQLRVDAETALARREPSGSSQLRPGGYEASPRPCSNAARSAAGRRGNRPGRA